ncbi:MAG: NFACT family protein [Oscillospiraceae bacterium]|jgi:predicted ribosome quality control (RQC) complex YloA/Tae2 family protein|nr:NFACT family protein [Oscillospiraceae bacterium]
MTLDAATLHYLRDEIALAVGARVEKIHQPGARELVLVLKNTARADAAGHAMACPYNAPLRLLICARPDAPRVHFISQSPENPATPPMFCMFLRKHLGGARLLTVRQEDGDRVLYLDFSATDELGDPQALTLCLELIPTRANVLLLQGGVVLDALRRVYPEMDARGRAARVLLPGVPYAPPPRPENYHARALPPRSEILEKWACGEAEDGQLPPLSARLESLFSQRDQAERRARLDGGLRQTLETLRSRTQRRVENQKCDLARAEDRETLKKYGELILAQQFQLTPGAAFYDVEDYYNGGEILRIPADPRLSPSANAQQYYKRYQKARTAQEALRGLIVAGEADCAYLADALDALRRATSSEEIAALRGELVAEGLLPERRTHAKASKKTRPLAPISLELEGFTVQIGRTAAQNEQLTFRQSRRGDLWLHAQKVPGAHVLIRAMDRAIPNSVTEQAAALAAWHSSARESGKVAVDIVPAKSLKKPAAARPGMVIYHTYTTIFVAPKADGLSK